MVRRVQFLNSFIIIFLTGIIVGCSNESQPSAVLIAQKGLEKNKGIYYFEEEPYTGIIYTLFENGDTAECSELNKGIKNGVGKKWWSNGQLKFRAHYQAGIYQGEVAEWYEDGSPFTRFNYNMGKEAGIQQAWQSDGSIKANYEVIGDRKYGLTGIKNCSNVWEE